jgi:multicomponent Na+:H+ antiporter subunit A
VAALALVLLAGGVVPGPAGELAGSAGRAVRGDAPPIDLAYHVARPETAMALVAWLAAMALVALRQPVARAAGAVSRAGKRAGPRRLYEAALDALAAFSWRLRRVEQRDLRGRLTPVLAPTAALVVVAVVATSAWRRFEAGSLSAPDVPVAVALAVAGMAAIATARRRRHLAIAVTLSTVGFSLAAAYAFLAAPDVALVAVLVETLLTVLFLGMVALFPAGLLSRQARQAALPGRPWRDALVATAAGALAFVVVLSALSGAAPGRPVAAEHLRLTPSAHGRDVVTVILADFRGLDTLGEITVLAVAFAGVLTLLRWGRP